MRTKTADRAVRLPAKPLGVSLTKFSGGKRLQLAAGERDARRQQARDARKRQRKLAKRDARRLAGSNDDPTHKRANRIPPIGLPTKGQILLPKVPSTYVGRLSSVIDWHRQVGKIYREMRRGQIDPGTGTRLTYVCNIGATLAKFVEETAPKGIDVPHDLSNLNDAELAQLEYLMTKASGHQPQQRIELGSVTREH